MKKLLNAISVLLAGACLMWLLGVALFDNANPFLWPKIAQNCYLVSLLFFSFCAFVEFRYTKNRPPGKP